MQNHIVEDLKRRIKNVALEKLTFGMLEEKVKLTGIHCIPISEKWLEKRKNNCIEILDAYMSGKNFSDLDVKEQNGNISESDWDSLSDEELWDDPEDVSWPDEE